ncbi:MAG: hypothetical protein Kow009_01910 [Spirochaetales bacterium]
MYAAGTLVDISDPLQPNNRACSWILNDSSSPTILDLPDPAGITSAGLGGLWVENGDVFIGGVSDSGIDRKPYLWKNGTPTLLSLPDGVSEGRVYGMYYSAGTLYLSGFYTDTSAIIPCYWTFDPTEGTSTIHDLSGYKQNTYNLAIAPFAYETTVYIGGGLGIPDADGWTPTYWKNGSPVPVPLPSGYTGGLVMDLTVRDGIVYLTGFYGDPEGVGSQAFIWNGATKLTVNSPDGVQGTQIFAITVE